MKPATGPKLLLDEIARRRITRAAAAVELGVSPVTLHFWVNEKHRPTGSRPELIEAWSEGRVPRSSWLSIEDREALKAVRKTARAVGS